MCQEIVGKWTKGCPGRVERASGTNEIANIENNIKANTKPKHPLMRPYHERVAEYKKVRARIFGVAKKVKRSSKRIQEYYRRLKSLRLCVISPIISPESDCRPYISMKLDGVNYLALLDSGANKSVVGGKLASEIREKKKFS